MCIRDSSVTVDQMVSYYNKRYTFPADIYRDKGADSAEAFFKILKEEAEAEGVRADVLFAQVMLETGGLKFGGDVPVSYTHMAATSIGLNTTYNATTSRTSVTHWYKFTMSKAGMVQLKFAHANLSSASNSTAWRIRCV